MQQNQINYEAKYFGHYPLLQRTIVHLRSLNQDVQVLVLNSDYGLGLTTQSPNNDLLPYNEQQIFQMDYSFLDRHRKSLLNLQTTKNWSTFNHISTVDKA